MRRALLVSAIEQRSRYNHFALTPQIVVFYCRKSGCYNCTLDVTLLARNLSSICNKNCWHPRDTFFNLMGEFCHPWEINNAQFWLRKLENAVKIGFLYKCSVKSSKRKQICLMLTFEYIWSSAIKTSLRTKEKLSLLVSNCVYSETNLYWIKLYGTPNWWS